MLRTTLSTLLVSSIGLFAFDAQAQNAELYHTHASNSLSMAEGEAKLLFGIISAKVFEPDLSKSTLTEIKKAVADAKKNTDRAQALLEDKQAKLAPEFDKMRETLVAIEGQLEKTKSLVSEQTKGLSVAEEPSLEDKGGGGGEPAEAKQPDWAAMKDEASWLFLDLVEASKKHKDLAKKLGVTPPTPAKPKTKRG